MPMLTTLRMRAPVWPRQRPLAHRLGEGDHAVEDGVHLGDDVDAADDERLARGLAQRDVQHRALLGRVDDVAAEHRRDALANAALARELDEQAHRLVGDAVLRVVEVQARGLDARAARRARGPAANSSRRWRCADLAVMRDEGAPRRALVDATAHAAWRSGQLRRLVAQAAEQARPTTSRTRRRLPSAAASRARRRRRRGARTRRSTASASPPSIAIGAPTWPWSANASRVLSGIVSMVSGAASAST